MYHILVVDDDPINTKILKFLLTGEGFAVTAVHSSDEALAALRQHAYDLIFLDILMPGGDGLDLCRRIKATATTPIIFLSGLDTVQDTVAGLAAGGDDYIRKPFDPHEVLARAWSALRRSGHLVNTASRIATADLLLDPIDNQVTVLRTGRTIRLTPIESSLLHALLDSPGHTLTRDTLADKVWGLAREGASNQLDVYIKRLRGKIEADPGYPHLLLTLRGVGYRYQPSGGSLRPAAIRFPVKPVV